MPRMVVALLLVGAMAGCIGPGIWGERGHCGPTSTDLTWQQAGLYDAFVSLTPGATWSGGEGALPWTNPWGNLSGVRLSSLELKVMQPTFHSRGSISFADPHLSHISLVRDGVVSAFVEGDVKDDVVLAAFHRMAANASLASNADIEEAAHRFLASKRDAGSRSAVPLDDDGKKFIEVMHWMHQAVLPGPLRLDEFVADLQVPFPLGDGVGRLAASAGNWTLEFTIPVWTVAGNQGQSLEIDSRGQAHYDGGDAHDGTIPGLKGDAEAFASAAGLPHLSLDGAGASTYIC